MSIHDQELINRLSPHFVQESPWGGWIVVHKQRVAEKAVIEQSTGKIHMKNKESAESEARRLNDQLMKNLLSLRNRAANGIKNASQAYANGAIGPAETEAKIAKGREIASHAWKLAQEVNAMYGN